MRRAKLDKIDKKILRDLQNNGRITNVELAKNAGISAPPCLRRVRALEDRGYIKGFLNPSLNRIPKRNISKIITLHPHSKTQARRSRRSRIRACSLYSLYNI